MSVEYHTKEVLQTDESRTIILEQTVNNDPMGHRRIGYEGMHPPLESTTYLTEREIIDFDLENDIEDQLRWLYAPARLRDIQADIDRWNLNRVSRLARRRSRNGFFISATLSPMLCSSSESVGITKEPERKKFSLNPFRR